MKLNGKAFALSCGLFWGGSLFFMTLLNLLTQDLPLFQASGGWGGSALQLLSSCYPGYDLTLRGLFLGLIYGLVDGTICGAILAILYNRLSSRLSTTIKI